MWTRIASKMAPHIVCSGMLIFSSSSVSAGYLCFKECGCGGGDGAISYRSIRSYHDGDIITISGVAASVAMRQQQRAAWTCHRHESGQHCRLSGTLHMTVIRRRKHPPPPPTTTATHNLDRQHHHQSKHAQNITRSPTPPAPRATTRTAAAAAPSAPPPSTTRTTGTTPPENQHQHQR
jgi:hypothetical protein